jgi:hypothetical protein
MRRVLTVLATTALIALVLPASAHANHAWNGYHWARTANPFTLMVGDNVDSSWDAYFDTAVADWTQSTVLNLNEVVGQAKGKNCRPTSGRVEVCNRAYGNNGWLGIAQIWIDNQQHITQGTTRVNDTYMTVAPYNTAPWHRLVMCQEVGHTLGLDHQDENFNNSNLGTCMDYTNDPDGPPSNEHPNQHDYDQLVTIYSHLDSYTTVGAAVAAPASQAFTERASWGREVAHSGRSSTFERSLGNGAKLITYVIWA